ncbi:cytochrome P450 [Streptomyces syringium]|uniref:Sterol 14-demethylase n=1 Tax=Streptomyces syringium TaxID=76729 RepID=A0ABS4XWN8_9ACTN|nr:cytochrome P450 [Streptomyces syringium]MBP2400923.1 sterol 14-demethylase [Streptomyces syringium]
MTGDHEPLPPGGRELPALDGGLPLIGHGIPFFRDPVGFLARVHSSRGEAVAFSLPGRRMASFCGPQANALILGLQDDTEVDRHLFYDPLLAPLLGPGVGLTAPSELMKWQHSLLLPLLRRDALTRHIPVMFDEVERYVAPWDGHGTFDLLAVMRDLSARIAACCLIGPRFGRTMGPALPRLLGRLEAALFAFAVIGPRGPLPHGLADRARETLVHAIKEIAPRDCPEGSERSHFEELMRATGPGGSSLDEDTAAALMVNWLFAAVPTTALAAWTGVLVLQHPQWLPVLRAEQEAAFADYPPTTLSALHKLERLSHCLLEAERLHPPIVVLPRPAARDLNIHGYRVPRGYVVCASPGLSHRLTSVFRRPEAFDPDRYLPDRAEHRTTPQALIGFGGGRHPCLGATLAQQTIKVIWSALLRAFDFELADPEVREARTTVMRLPRRPCTVRYRRRKR